MLSFEGCFRSESSVVKVLSTGNFSCEGCFRSVKGSLKDSFEVFEREGSVGQVDFHVNVTLTRQFSCEGCCHV